MEDLDKPLTEEEQEALYQSLRDNVDHEEAARRGIFNQTQGKENKQRQANYKYLKSSY
jgi:hypothetical protein